MYTDMSLPRKDNTVCSFLSLTWYGYTSYQLILVCEVWLVTFKVDCNTNNWEPFVCVDVRGRNGVQG